MLGILWRALELLLADINLVTFQIGIVGEQRPGQATSLSLLQRARANDQQAWARLTALYRPLVLFWCRQARCPDATREAPTASSKRRIT